jgi:hypothetical protein
MHSDSIVSIVQDSISARARLAASRTLTRRVHPGTTVRMRHHPPQGEELWGSSLTGFSLLSRRRERREKPVSDPARQVRFGIKKVRFRVKKRPRP